LNPFEIKKSGNVLFQKDLVAQFSIRTHRSSINNQFNDLFSKGERVMLEIYYPKEDEKVKIRSVEG